MHFRRTTLFVAGALCLSVCGTGVAGEPIEVTLNRAALRVQREALDKLSSLMKRYQGTALDRRLRILRVEMEQQAATLEFRAAHGLADVRGGEADLRQYRAQLQAVAKAAGDALASTPADEENAHLLFLRAGALEELEQKEAALKDYIAIATGFPTSPWAIRGDLAIADRAAEANNYQAAIPYLKKVLEHEDDPHFPFGLNKMAWAYFNLQDLDNALPLAEKQVRFYDEKGKTRKNGLLESERALRDHALLDYAEFYFAGVERKLPKYTVGRALDAFRDLDKGDGLGKMALRFAKLLRSRKMANGLRDWTETLVKEEPARSETASVVATAIDAELDGNHFDRLPALLAYFHQLDESTHHQTRQFESYATTLKQLLGWTVKLQQPKQKSVLAAVYGAYLDLAEPKDPQLAEVHFNLAETLFQLQDFTGATTHYRWLVEQHATLKGFAQSEIALRAASSRYQELRARKFLATTVLPKALSGPTSAPWKEIDAGFAEWVSWIDAYTAAYGDHEAAVAAMRLSADLTLYQLGYTQAAFERLWQRLRIDPGHSHAEADASLLLDTAFASHQWDRADKLASEFLTWMPLGREPFAQKLHDVKADAFYRRLDERYQAGDYAGLLTLVPPYLREGSHRDRDADSLILASRAASQLHDGRTARHYLNIALTEFPKAPAHAAALLTLGAQAETEYHFETALVDYEAFLKEAARSTEVTAQQRETVQRRIFALRWLGSNAPLDCTPYANNAGLIWECEKYAALDLLTRGGALDAKHARQKALEGPRDNRAIWAALALRNADGFTIPERLALVSALSTGWANLDAVAQFAVIPELNSTLPLTFAKVRKSLHTESPLRPTTASISRRIKLLGSVETTAGSVIKLPWARVRVAVLSEVAQAYLAFAKELADIKAPAGISPEELAAYKKSINEIVAPFEQKGKMLASQANEVGSDLAIDPNGIDGLAPNGAIASRALASTPVTKPIELSLLDNVEGKTWSNLVVGIQPRSGDNLRALWVDALRRKAWGRVAYFSQAYLQQEKPPATVAELMKAISLYAVGARSEALTALEAIRGDLPEDIRDRTNEVLVSNYQQTLASKKAAALVQTIGNEWVSQMLRGIE